MYLPVWEQQVLSAPSVSDQSVLFSRIYIVHDEVKDKAFELELSWVGEGKNQSGLSFSSSLVC